jgi:hypothetical protein
MTREEAKVKTFDILRFIADNAGLSMFEAIEKAYNMGLSEQEQKTGHCKDCKYFEYDSWANVNGIPLIVAHEICKRWGDGCKTWEDGYCFLFEPQEDEESEDEA